MKCQMETVKVLEAVRSDRGLLVGVEDGDRRLRLVPGPTHVAPVVACQLLQVAPAGFKAHLVHCGHWLAVLVGHCLDCSFLLVAGTNLEIKSSGS